MTINLKRTLDADSVEGRALLNDLQGNILEPHKREHTMHAFLCFGVPTSVSEHKSQVKGALKFIRKLTTDKITTAADEIDNRDRKSVFTSLLLSSKGYEFLQQSRPEGGAFREGMRERRRKLRDTKFQNWSPRFKVDEDHIHALVIVGAPRKTKKADAHKQLDKIKDSLQKGLKKFGGSILIDQRGDVVRNNKKHAIEHFGYVDGVSQPDFFGTSTLRKYNQNAPLKLVLCPDRHSESGYGSYVVYRVLEQNVASFNAAVKKVADTLGISAELAGAMAMGRFKNGTPITTNSKPKPNYNPKKDEDFNYKGDSGSRCPFHGHVRKTNPRGSVGKLFNVLAREERRRIARRGITYEDAETNTKGLLFICYQSDIVDQFEFIQRRWANEKSFSRADAGLDPVIGQDEGTNDVDEFPNWPKKHGSPGRERIRFDQHVKLMGGEYFFAPSISGLMSISGA